MWYLPFSALFSPLVRVALKSEVIVVSDGK